MRIRAIQLTSEDWEQRIGATIRSLRIAAGRDQVDLAAAAAISVGALRNLERGNGSTLRTMIQVLRALDREDWLDDLAPTTTISPLDVFRSRAPQRSRVYRPRGTGA